MFVAGDTVSFFLADLQTKYGTIISISHESDFAENLIEIWVPYERKTYLVSNVDQIRHSDRIFEY